MTKNERRIMPCIADDITHYGSHSVSMQHHENSEMTIDKVKLANFSLNNETIKDKSDNSRHFNDVNAVFKKIWFECGQTQHNKNSKQR